MSWLKFKRCKIQMSRKCSMKDLQKWLEREKWKLWDIHVDQPQWREAKSWCHLCSHQRNRLTLKGAESNLQRLPPWMTMHIGILKWYSSTSLPPGTQKYHAYLGEQLFCTILPHSLLMSRPQVSPLVPPTLSGWGACNNSPFPFLLFETAAETFKNTLK